MVRHCALVVCLLSLSVGWSADGASAMTSTSPSVVSVSPGLGTGAGRTFTFVYSDPDGASDIATTEALIAGGTELTGVNACYFFASGNQLWLRDDAHSAWMGPVTAGGSGTVTNSQCTLTAAGSSLSPSGNSLIMTVTVTFGVSFAGPKTLYMKATDRTGLSSDWVRGGTWTVSPLNPGLDVITSSCTDSARDNDLSIQIINEQGGRVERIQTTPSCFPRYSFYSFQEGYFTDDLRPLPITGRTCGHFEILVVFVDTEFNRRKLLDNSAIPAGIKDRLGAGQLTEALTELFASYTSAEVMSGLRREAASVVDFTFSVALTRISRQEMEWGADGGLGFPNYDAVLVLDDLTPNAGHGVHRWPSLPSPRPLFHAAGGGFLLNIDPMWLTPGLFGNELLRRNVPTLLSEYQIGDRTLVTVGGVTYDRTPVINRRTGENIEPLIRAYEGKTSIGVYLAGYADVDGDGIVDCIDPTITPTADNVDGDFIPDRFDPDLRLNHRPYSWMYAAWGGLQKR